MLKLLSKRSEHIKFGLCARPSTKIFSALAFVAVIFLACLGFWVASSGDTLAQVVDNDARIRQLESQIDSYNQEIQKYEAQAQSLSVELAIFDLQIKQIQAEIDATTLTIQSLKGEIAGKEADIAKKEAQISHENSLLSQYLREVVRNESSSLFEFLLRNRRFSDFFNDLNYLNNVQEKIHGTLAKIKDLRAKLVEEKEDLESQKAEQEQLRQIQKKQQNSLTSTRKAKQKLLDQTKGQEKKYQDLIAKTRADIEKIKNQPYELAQGYKLTFEQALRYATLASQHTGVRPAFLLGILKIESDWGGNVGKGTWQKDMHPRDFDAFKQITAALSLDPNSTPVSKKPSYGWGGAMGPAQFIPSTWVLYAATVSNLTGHNPPSPWNYEDAFTASGLMLAQSGADKQIYAAELKAAKIYIAGGRWNRSLTARIYANNVMAAAAKIQKDINALNNQ